MKLQFKTLIIKRYLKHLKYQSKSKNKVLNTDEITVQNITNNAKDEISQEVLRIMFFTAVDFVICVHNKNPFYIENTEYTRDSFKKWYKLKQEC